MVHQPWCCDVLMMFTIAIPLVCSLVSSFSLVYFFFSRIRYPFAVCIVFIHGIPPIRYSYFVSVDIPLVWFLEGAITPNTTKTFYQYTIFSALGSRKGSSIFSFWAPDRVGR